MEFKEAPDPTDVIWENLETTDTEISRNECFTTLAIAFFLLLSSSIFYLLKQSSNDNMFKYPNAVYCNTNIIPLVADQNYKKRMPFVPKNENSEGF